MKKGRASFLMGAAALASLVIAWRLWGPIPVIVEHPQRGPAVQAVYATGNVEPPVLIPIAARSAGHLVAVHVDEDDRVTQGQVLARIEDADLQQSVEELESRARFARDQYHRTQSLFERKLSSSLDRDRTLSDWQAAKAVAERARVQRAYMTLTAPVAGHIVRRDGEVGQLVAAHQTLFYLACCGPLRITTDVDEEDILLVRPGQRVLIRAAALPDKTLEGRVAALTPRGDTSTRSYRVRIALEGETPLRVGMTAEINILVTQREQALLVPATAVAEGKLWVVREHLLHHQAVEVGIQGELRIEILSGLTDDDLLAAHPMPDFREGRRVRLPDDPFLPGIRFP
ncbi:HlyD family secretion protein [Gammaproteobacteria bacterium]